MQLFYKKEFKESLTLDEIDSKHCVRVLRKRNGDEISVTDGEGGMYLCGILDANPKKTALKILKEQQEFELVKRNIHLAIAPTKNIDRMTYLVEKATEIGISEISFLQTTNSERKTIKTERIERVAIAAMKQSLKAYLPKINEQIRFEEFLKQCYSQQKFIAHLEENSQPLVNYNIGNDCCLLIGPEGDFTQEEVELARQNKCEMISLGNSRLRTETAGLVGVTLLNLLK